MGNITRLVAVCACLVGALSLLPACEMDCGPQGYSLDGRCVPICGPGRSVGDDGLCHDDPVGDSEPEDEPPASGSDGAADDGVPAEREPEPEDEGSDVEPGEEPPPTPPSSGGACDDEASCAALASEAVDLLNGYREDLGECGPGSLAVDPLLTAAAEECAVMMRDSHRIAACGGTLHDRLLAVGYDDIRYAAEALARATTLEQALDGLVTSEGAHDDVLDCHYNFVGVGVAAGERSLWVSIVFLELLEL